MQLPGGAQAPLDIGALAALWTGQGKGKRRRKRKGLVKISIRMNPALELYERL